MRKTPQYFVGKLSKMYKQNVMSWLADRLDSRSIKKGKQSDRMYYQYENMEEIERKIQLGEVISGFTLKADPSKLIVGYGGNRRSGLINCVEVRRLNKGRAKKCVGLAYVKVELRNGESEVMTEVDLDFLVDRIEHYFLMLPLIDHGDFAQEFSLIYEDWDTADENFRKCLPSLCKLCFEEDVL